MDEVVEAVLVDEALRDVGELDLGVLRAREWGSKVVVDDVVGDELGPFL